MIPTVMRSATSTSTIWDPSRIITKAILLRILPNCWTPGNYEIVGLTPLLETDEFYDPNTDDVHSQTQWKIIRADDQFCVFDATTNSVVDLPEGAEADPGGRHRLHLASQIY